MLGHLVILTPRPGLTAGDRLALVRAFRHAVTSIEGVRGVRLGRRVTHGADYERTAPPGAGILALIEFEDLAGLQAYLRHPAHDELSARFHESLDSALVLDFDLGGMEKLEELAEGAEGERG